MTAPDLRALAEAATPGPWDPEYVWQAVRHIVRNCDFIEGAPDSEFGWDYGPRGEGDPAYIAAASPDVILALLDEIDALRDVAETALQNTLPVMADDMRLRDADVILQRNTGSGRVPRGRALDGAPFDDDCDPDATPAPLGGAA